MKKPVRYESLVPPRNDEERELMDPDAWDWENAEVLEPVPNPGAVLEVRFEREEFSALTRLAREEGIGPVEYLRRLALDRISAGHVRKRAS